MTASPRSCLAFSAGRRFTSLLERRSLAGTYGPVRPRSVSLGAARDARKLREPLEKEIRQPPRRSPAERARRGGFSRVLAGTRASIQVRPALAGVRWRFVTADYVRSDPNTPEVRGPEAERGLAAMYRAAFPDLHFTIEHLVAEGDMVLARLTARGTHRGELMGIPPIDRHVTVAAMELYRLTDGKIAEQWVTMDARGLLQQLGAIPGPAQEDQ